MKKIALIIFLFVLSSPSFSQTGWVKLTSGVKEALLWDVSFCDSLHGVVIGARFTALRTSDGGMTWDSIFFPLDRTSWLLKKVIFNTDTSGFLLASNEGLNTHTYHLYITTDKGLSWSDITTLPKDSPRVCYDICFPTATTGYLLGADQQSNHPQLQKTVDGGKHWVNVAPPPGRNCFSDRYHTIIFRDTSNGIATNECDTVLYSYTYDGGKTWREMSGPDFPSSSYGAHHFGFSKKNRWLFEGHDSSKILIKDKWEWESSRGFKYRDRFFSWGKFTFFDSLIGYVAQKNLFVFDKDDLGCVLKTTDGGDSWMLQDPNIGNEIYAIATPTKNIAYAVGDSGMILKTIDGGGVATSVPVTNFSDSIFIYPNPATSFIHIISSGHSRKTVVLISNALGEIIIRKELSALEPTIELDLSAVSPGVYTVVAAGQIRKVVKIDK